MVAITVLITVVLTIVTLVVGGWTGGRPRLPGGRAEDAQRGRQANPDGWHGDPRPDVVDRPAGADAESMNSEDRPPE
jgi:hypothetical protein